MLNLNTLTVSDFKTAANNFAKYVKVDKYGQSKRDTAERRVVLETGGTTCRNDTLVQNRGALDNINFEDFQKRLREDYLDPKTMYEALCLFQAISTSPSVGSGTPIHERVTRYLNDIFRVGAASANGLAAVGAVGNLLQGNAENSVIIKTPTSEGAAEDFTHEFFVGTYGTNQLRNSIPNFALIYAKFSCNPPLLSFNDKEVVSFCSSDYGGDMKEYILYENLFGSKDMATTVKEGIGMDHIYSYLLQIIYSLALAVPMVGFTHYDLHSENVLIRPLPQNQEVVYLDYFIKDEDGQDELFLIPKIATFIDYGYSRVEYKGKSYGKYGIEKYGVNPEKANPLFDIFKLCMFVAGDAIESDNLNVVEGMRKIIHTAFFSSQNKVQFNNEFENFVNYSRDNFHEFPFETPANFDLYEFALKIRRAFPEYSSFFKPRSQAVDFPIVQYHSFTDIDKNAIDQLNEMSNNQRLPTDVMGFTDIHVYLKKLKGERKNSSVIDETLNKMVKEFNYNQAFSNASEEIKSMIKEADVLIDNRVPDYNDTRNFLNNTISLSKRLSNNVHAHFIYNKIKNLNDAFKYTMEVGVYNQIMISKYDQAKNEQYNKLVIDKIDELKYIIVEMIQLLDLMAFYGQCLNDGYGKYEDFLEMQNNEFDKELANNMGRNSIVRAVRDGIFEYGKMFDVPTVNYGNLCR